MEALECASPKQAISCLCRVLHNLKHGHLIAVGVLLARGINSLQMADKIPPLHEIRVRRLDVRERNGLCTGRVGQYSSKKRRSQQFSEHTSSQSTCDAMSKSLVLIF